MSTPIIKNLKKWDKPILQRMGHDNLDFLVELSSRVAFHDSRLQAGVKQNWTAWMPLGHYEKHGDNEENKKVPVVFFLKDILESSNIEWAENSYLGVAYLDEEYAVGKHRLVVRLDDSGKPEGIYYISSGKFNYRNDKEKTVGMMTRIFPAAMGINFEMPDLKPEYPNRDAVNGEPFKSQGGIYNSPKDVMSLEGILFTPNNLYSLLKDRDNHLRGWAHADTINQALNAFYLYDRKSQLARLEFGTSYRHSGVSLPALNHQGYTEEIEKALEFTKTGQLSKPALGL